jgi:glyoxalase family protein
MEPLITTGFHHITMVSQNAQRTRSFYRDLLGIKMVKKTVNFDDPGAYHLYLGDSGGSPGTILTFFEWPQAGKGGWGVGGIHHLALGTLTPESLLMWKRWLIDHGVSVSGPYNRGYFRSIYFQDPDGQILEIATEGPGFAIDEPMDALGQKLIRPPAKQLKGSRDETEIDQATHPDPIETITPAMALTGIHHITGMTDDIDRADRFYSEALGLRLIKRSINQDDPDTLHYFWGSYDGKEIKPHSDLTLFGWPKSAQRAHSGVGQTHHIAFRAKDDAEQLAWREHLLSLGVSVSPVMDRTYFKSIYFKAPDGLLLEIATDGPGFVVDEDPERLGAALKLPSWLEAQRTQIEAKLSPIK